MANEANRLAKIEKKVRRLEQFIKTLFDDDSDVGKYVKWLSGDEVNLSGKAGRHTRKTVDTYTQGL
jgi:hypothetical protein